MIRLIHTNAKKTKIVHAVRYTGNDGDQYVRNRAGYLTYSGDDFESALDFGSITAANEWALQAGKVVGESCFVVESREIVVQ